MEYKLVFTQLKSLNIRKLLKLNLGCYCKPCCNVLYFSSSTGSDRLLENLLLGVTGKNEKVLSKYFEQNSQKPIITPASINILNEEIIQKNYKNIAPSDLVGNIKITDLVKLLERNIDGKDNIPNDSLNYLLVYFAKNGNVSGVKAIQFIVKKHNISHFKLKSGYDHYLAEALWINGKIEDSLKLFLAAYDNSQLRNKIKIMLTCLFPLLVTHHGESVVRKTVYAIERLSSEKDDHIILGCLWKELFQSNWFSDQQLSKQILFDNPHLLPVIQWMIPIMGKELLKSHKVEDFYRLLEFTLENKLQSFEQLLVRLLFDYYYIHRNIERCSAVVKYRSGGESPLTDEQLRRFLNLLVNSKDSVTSKTNIKKPQNMKYKF